MQPSDSTFPQQVISLFQKLHPLDRVQRAGFVLRGVTEPESVAAHSHFVALLTLLFVNQYPSLFDRAKALTMALIHDLPEAVLMDIPMPASELYLQAAKADAELAILGDLFSGFDKMYSACQQELIARRTPEARLVAGLDKAQLILKVFCYQQEGRGKLAEFWKNPANFNDFGLKPVAALFDALCRAAGCSRPVAADHREFL